MSNLTAVKPSDVFVPLRSADIRNVVILIPDALRWDYLPKSVSDLGVSIKTVAASIWTPVSFVSILSGVCPEVHGVRNFFDDIPKDLPLLTEQRGYNTSLYSRDALTDMKHRLLRQYGKNAPLREMEPPFIYVEATDGAHAPYGWCSNDAWGEADAMSFFEECTRQPREWMLKKYKEGADNSTNELLALLGELDQRGLADSTLVIYTSDHGEALGEHEGCIGHGITTTREQVYVPTVFIHPSLPKGVALNGGVMRHTDIFPTVLSVLGEEIPEQAEGKDITAVDVLPRVGYSFFVSGARDRVLRLVSPEERGRWETEQGSVSRSGTTISRVLWALKLCIRTKPVTVHLSGKGMVERLRAIDFIRRGRWEYN